MSVNIDQAYITQIVGEKGIVPQAAVANYAVDGVLPGIVVLPDSVEQASRLLAFAHEHGLSVIPWGGGTAMSVGHPPTSADMVIVTSRLARVLDYSPEDLTVTVQAGVTLAHLQELLAGHNQMLPLDPPLPGRSTVGGILATNASGPLRYQFGTPRDLVLGTLVVYADGTVAKAGGRTVKNVAGYDMSRLHIGAFGSLGIIVEATFKVSPVPKTLVTVAGRFATVAEAIAGARALRMARIVPWSLVLVPPSVLPGMADRYTVAVRLGGQPAVVGPQTQRALDTLKEAQAEDVTEIDGAEKTFWPALRDWPAVVGDEKAILVRMGVAPSQVGAVLASVQDIANHHNVQASMLTYPDAATVYCCLDEAGDKAVDAVAGMVAVVREWNGNLVVERCRPQLKQRLPVWGTGAADTLSQRVKQSFDPKGTLNPGRFVGGL